MMVKHGTRSWLLRYVSMDPFSLVLTQPDPWVIPKVIRGTTCFVGDAISIMTYIESLARRWPPILGLDPVTLGNRPRHFRPNHLAWEIGCTSFSCTMQDTWKSFKCFFVRGGAMNFPIDVFHRLVILYMMRSFPFCRGTVIVSVLFRAEARTNTSSPIRPSYRCIRNKMTSGCSLILTATC